MDLLNGILGVSLLLSLITIVVLMRYTISQRMDMQNIDLRLNRIENDVRRFPDQCPTKQQLEEIVHPNSVAPKNKPDSIELIRDYMHFYHPTLTDSITRQTGEKLSSTDELLCMMIKLEYTNKEIGSLLSIANSSVLTARYRLKRKLGLPQQQQLDTWIQRME